MPNRSETNLELIDDLWELHRACHPSAKSDGRCLAFVVDPRYALLPRFDETVRFRLGVSFGHNPYIVGMQGFALPTIHPGPFVFGLHLVASRDRQLTIYDSWMDAFDAGNCQSADDAVSAAAEILKSIDDSTYINEVSEIPKPTGISLHLDSLCEISSFEVVHAGAF